MIRFRSVRSVPFFLFILMLILCVILPVSADVSMPTITHIYFEKDGAPVNENIRYTVTCYGHYEYPLIQPETASGLNGTPVKEVIYTYTATCADYGCTVYEPYYLNYRVIDSCDLEGEAGGEHFSIKDFSNTPLPPDCTNLQPFHIMTGPRTQNPEYERCTDASEPKYDSCTALMAECRPGVDLDCIEYGGRMIKDTPASIACYRESANATRTCDSLRNPDEYYNTTPEYEECVHATYADSDLCSRFMEECNPVSDSDCGNWIIDGTYVRNTPEAIACRDAADKKRRDCAVFLKRVDPSTMIMWIDPHTKREAGPALRECTVRFEIPKNDAPPSVFSGDSGLPLPEKSPVTSLYCSLLSLFGVKC